MKSAFLSLIILIFIFFALNSGVLSAINSSAFHYLSLLAFVIVVACAAMFIGFKPKEDITEIPEENKEDTDDA